MHLLRKFVFHNWHLKLFSLLIAFLLWATYSAEPAAEIGFLAPIEFHHLPEHLELAGEVPTHVYLRVRGRSALLRRLTARDFAVPLDLRDAQAGEKLIRLAFSDVDAPAGVEVVRISPATLRLQFVARNPNPPR